MEENKKQELVVDEPPVEEPTKEEVVIEESEVVATTQAFDNEDVVVGEVVGEGYPELEDLKKGFGKMYRKSRWVSYLSSAIVIAIIVVAYTVLFPIPEQGTMLGIIVIIITLVLSFVFSKLHRNYLTKRIKQYMSDYNEKVNEIALKDSKINDYAFDFGGTIDKQQFVNARFLKDIIDANSRNLCGYKIGRFDVELADFVAYRQDGKRAKAVFLGKFVNATASETINGRIIFYLKPDPEVFKDAAGPDDLEGLELIDDKPRYRLYATNKEVKKSLPLKAINALLKIMPNQELADVTVSMYENKVAVILTYSDTLMVVPYKEQIPSEAIRKYNEHLTEVNNFLSLL